MVWYASISDLRPRNRAPIYVLQVRVTCQHMSYAFLSLMCQTPQHRPSYLYEICTKCKSFETVDRISKNQKNPPFCKEDMTRLSERCITYISEPERIPPSNPIVSRPLTASTIEGSMSSEPTAPSICRPPCCRLLAKEQPTDYSFSQSHSHYSI
jgi:hypothetical protein